MAQDSVVATTTDFSGRTALVTGGGSGIGRAIAVALAARGMDVLVVGRREDALRATATLHTGIRHQVGDVSEPADIAGIMAAAGAELDRIDVLVNNAGMGTGWASDTPALLRRCR